LRPGRVEATFVLAPTTVTRPLVLLVGLLCVTAAAHAAPTAKDWDREVGNKWARVFGRTRMSRSGSVIEVAPGGTAKVGQGLAAHRFNGTLYVVEPERAALAQTIRAYRGLMPNARIVPVGTTLRDALGHLPSHPDAVVANHPLDDMIIGHSLGQQAFNQFFHNHYEVDDAMSTIAAWRELLRRPGALDLSKAAVVRDWKDTLEHLSPRLVLLSQYQSFFFKSHELPAPDQQAAQVLRLLRNTYRQHDLTVGKGLGELVDEQDRWLLLKR
jgi:hypothetical protein